MTPNISTPGEIFVRWAMEHCKIEEVYNQFEFKSDATDFWSFYHPMVNKINKIFAEILEEVKDQKIKQAALRAELSSAREKIKEKEQEAKEYREALERLRDGLIEAKMREERR